jgi:hypothetical protein
MKDEHRTATRPGSPEKTSQRTDQKYGAFVRLSEYDRRALTWSEKYDQDGAGTRLQMQSAARAIPPTTDLEIDDEFVARAIDRALQDAIREARYEYARQQQREGVIG